MEIGMTQLKKQLTKQPTRQQLIKAVDSKKVHQIRCGEHRFIDITIVQTEGRFFVRQYKFGKRSWYDAFLDNPSVDGQPNGAMKVKTKNGDIEVHIIGKVPDDLDSINPKVNKAYFKLLWIFYPLMRLTYDRNKHEASTLELVPLLK